MPMSVKQAETLIPDPPAAPATTVSDGELAQRWCQGDRHAGGLLIERHQAVVRSFLRKLVSRADWADDLAQETFLRLLRHADRYDSRYPMRTWLLTIARRLYLNHAQLAQHRAKPLDAEPPQTARHPHENQIDNHDQQAHQQKIIQQGLATLSEPQRTALVLFYQQEMSIGDIANLMQQPEGTVKSHLSRGRSALRSWLQSHPSMQGVMP